MTTAAPYQPDKGPQGPGAPYNAAAKFSPSIPATPRSITTSASPMSRSTASTSMGGQRNLVPAAAAAPQCGGRPLPAGAALSRPAHQSQPAPYDRGRHARTARALPSDSAGRAAGRQLPGLPSEPCARCPPSRSKRHRNGSARLRTRHCRALRRAAILVQRLSARQRRRAAPPGRSGEEVRDKLMEC